MENLYKSRKALSAAAFAAITFFLLTPARVYGGKSAKPARTGYAAHIHGTTSSLRHNITVKPDRAHRLVSDRLYVAEGASGAGTSWQDAIGSLSQAIDLAAANPGILEIWVKAGTYKPSGMPYGASLADSRNQAFYLINNVIIYGGFAGNETQLSERNWGINQTILSGDLGVAGDVSDNAYHVIMAISNTSTAQLDGFVIRDGNAVGPAASISGKSVSGVTGGGVTIRDGSPKIINCVMTANNASFGGGLYTHGPTVLSRVSNCLFTTNTATAGGGAIAYGTSSAPRIENCTLAGNAALNATGGGIYNNFGGEPVIFNTLVWGNTANSRPGISGLPTIYNSLVQGGISGTANLSSDPQFADAADPDGPDNKWMTDDDGYQLTICSPAINKGLTAAATASTDILGQPRRFDVVPDIGAYERQQYMDGTSLAEDGEQVTKTMTKLNTYGFVTSDCRILAQLTPSGEKPLLGDVQVRTYVKPSVLEMGTVQFVQRHYVIVPEADQTTSSATVKLYFTQAEFDAFNSVTTGRKLPASAEDIDGKGNLLIVEFHGTSPNALPGTYSGPTEPIDPADENIVWNPALNRWEVTFDVNGFSGFFITNMDALPLKLVSFSAKAVENRTRLDWLTSEEANTSHFEIQRSGDARQWTTLPDQPKAAGNGSARYQSLDRQPLPGLNYYRLKMVDLDGTFAYSHIVTADFKAQPVIQWTVYPNPAQGRLYLEIVNVASTGGTAEIFNASGSLVASQLFTGTHAEINSHKLRTGTYVLKVHYAGQVMTKQFVIE